MRKTLCSVIAALSMIGLGSGANSGCAGETTNISYKTGIIEKKEDTPFQGIGFEQEKKSWVIGGEIDYNYKKESKIVEKELDFGLIKPKVLQLREKYFLRTSLYLSRKMAECGPDYLKLDVRLGGGLTLLTTAGGTKYEIDGNYIGGLPSSIRFDVLGFGQGEIHLKSNLGFDWGGKINLGYTFRVNSNGEVVGILSTGLDF